MFQWLQEGGFGRSLAASEVSDFRLQEQRRAKACPGAPNPESLTARALPAPPVWLIGCVVD